MLFVAYVPPKSTLAAKLNLLGGPAAEMAEAAGIAAASAHDATHGWVKFSYRSTG